MDHTPEKRREDIYARERNEKFEEYLRELKGEPPLPPKNGSGDEDPEETVEFKTVRFGDDGEIVPQEDDIVFVEPPRKKRKWLKRIFLTLLALILALAVAAGIFVYRKLSLINTTGDDFLGFDTMENDIDAGDIDSITDAGSLQALLKEWATNDGDLMESQYVKNILLIGIDSKSKLSDSMILASINLRSRQISLVSFYRDSYTYVDDQDAPYFAKLNASYNTGGAELVRDTIEKDYKIKIDDYALVGYKTFPKVIDALGGVDVEVTEKEANYLNRTWWKWSQTGKKIQFKSGKMHMDGEHALMFARIRGLDSDVGRTERQRRVILAIMSQFKGATVSEMNAAVNTLLPNIKTSMSKSEILNYASKAVTDGWGKFPITQMSMPTEETCLPGYAGDQWIWICDFEAAAQLLQQQLYGQSNITLAEDRVSALDFAQGETSATTNANYWTAAYQPANQQTHYYNYTTASGNLPADPEDDPDVYTSVQPSASTTRGWPWWGGGNGNSSNSAPSNSGSGGGNAPLDPEDEE